MLEPRTESEVPAIGELSKLTGVACAVREYGLTGPNVTFRLKGSVADIDDTCAGEPEHPALALILECGDDLTRIVVRSSVWPPEKRALLAVDRPIVVTGESDVDPFHPCARAVATSLLLLHSYH